MAYGQDELRIILEEDERDPQRVEKDMRLGIEFPLYRGCYVETLKAISNHIRRHEGWIENRRRRMEEPHIPEAGRLRNNVDSNIFAFIGTRGSGKTTAVNEFCRLLYHYPERAEVWKEELAGQEEMGKGCQFYMMPPIDASVLEAEEDLIELIWANMYQLFEQRASGRSGVFAGDELVKTIMREFDEVYKTYSNVGHGERREVLGESVLVKLRNVSSSLKTREAFEKLLGHFLEFIDRKDHGEKTYLVITVDDLDLNLKKGYGMLEQLHKYLSDPRILILVAIDYRQMRRNCETYFVNELMSKHNLHEEYERISKHAKKLNNDYLLKVLPLSNRIYLPDRDILFRKARVEEAGHEDYLKEFILRKIAAGMSIYYDGLGKEPHFSMTGTVRELVSYNHFLNSLFRVEAGNAKEEKGQETAMYLYDRNHERFNMDITNRMAQQTLEDDQLDIFQRILDRNVAQRAAYAVVFIHGYRCPSLSGNGIQDNVDELHYCYGDLLEELYLLGRENYEDKLLVHCLLASFTSEMVREYYSYRNNHHQDAWKRAETRLRGLLGHTFGGTWFKGSAPLIAMNPESSSQVIRDFGFIRRGQVSNLEIELDYDWPEEDNAFREICGRMIELVPYLECLQLLFADFQDNTGKSILPEWRFMIFSGRNNQNLQIVITSNADTASFDIFGFIGKEIGSDDEGDFHKRLVENMWREVYDWAERKGHGPVLEKDRREFIKKASAHSIWKKRTNQTKNRQKAEFPFYNLDLCYNVMKRVRRMVEERMEERIRPAQLYSHLCRIYGYIAQELYEEDNYYKNICMEVESPKLYDNFVECPFIRAFGLRMEGNAPEPYQETSLDGTQFNEILFQTIKSLAVTPGTMLKADRQDEEP